MIINLSSFSIFKLRARQISNTTEEEISAIFPAINNSFSNEVFTNNKT